jgi:hypothetical protein
MPDSKRGTLSVKRRPKHSIKEEWEDLDKKSKIALTVRILTMLLPLVVYIIYCVSYLSADAVNTKAKYYKDPDTNAPSNLTVRTSEVVDPSSSEAFYVNVKCGVEVKAISNISPSNSTFVEQYDVWFDFNVKEFKNMVFKRIYGDNADIRVDIDNTGLASSNCYTQAYHPNINYASYLPTERMDWNMGGKAQISGAYPKTLVEGKAYDPNTTADATFDAPDDTTRYFQEKNILTTIHKDFESPRYPLESLQFTGFVTPSMDIKYMRLVPDSGSHLSTALSMDNGFNPISDTAEQFKTNVYYFTQPNYRPYTGYDEFIVSELQFSLRANRNAGWNLFMQAFLTLFAVMVWCFIAYFSLTYNHEDVTGTLGAGIFSAVSSILIGVSLLSDAARISLVNMINIFALVVILMMFFVSMNAKRLLATTTKPPCHSMTSS